MLDHPLGCCYGPGPVHPTAKEACFITPPDKAGFGSSLICRLFTLVKEPRILFKMLEERHALPLLSIVLLIIGTNFIIFLDLPLLRPAFGFITLSVVPGVLLLYILGINPGSPGKYLGYCLGASLTFLVLIVLFMHAVYPLFGIGNPLSLVYLLPTVSFFLLTLAVVVYSYTERKLTLPSLEIRRCSSPVVLVLVLILLLSILGSYQMNYLGDNTLNLLYIVAVGATTLTLVSKKIPESHYSLMIYVIMLSLLLHRNLISDYIIGADSQLHFFYANQILLDGFWDYRIGNVSTLLITSAVPVIYSVICGINLHWVFKLFYSLTFAFVPVGIYYVFRTDLGARVAAIGALFFAFYYRSFDISPDKQFLSEFFLILILMLLVATNISRFQRYFLMVIFFFSMIVSHYGVSLIFLIALIPAYLITYYIRREGEPRVITMRLIGVYFALFITWFTFIGSGEVMSRIMLAFNHVLADVQGYLIPSSTATSRSGADYVATTLQAGSMLFQINLGLYLIMTALIVIGVISLLWYALYKRKICLNHQVFALILPFFMFLGASYLINGGLGADRAYQISLILLSPIVVFGYGVLSRLSANVWGLVRGQGELRPLSGRSPTALIPATVLLVLLLFFNTGFIYEISGNPVDSAISLNKDSNSLAYLESEMTGAVWLHGHSEIGDPTAESAVLTDNKNALFADEYSYYLLLEFYSSPGKLHPFSEETLSELGGADLNPGPFFFVRDKCIVQDESNENRGDGSLTTDQISLLEHTNSLIYTNNGCAVYF